MIRPKVRLAALVAVPVLLWGCASPNVHFAEAQALYGNADYYQAYQAVLLAREQDPDNAEIERAYWVFRHGYLLSEAQRLVFSNQEHLALDLIEKILALDPDDPIALRWKGKAYDKLANRAVDEGDRMIGGGDLAGALVAFDRALKYDPGSIRAREGIDKLSETWTRQQDQARTHFVDGVRALGDYQYRRTSYHLGIAIEKDPTLEVLAPPSKPKQSPPPPIKEEPAPAPGSQSYPVAGAHVPTDSRSCRPPREADA